MSEDRFKLIADLLAPPEHLRPASIRDPGMEDYAREEFWRLLMQGDHETSMRYEEGLAMGDRIGSDLVARGFTFEDAMRTIDDTLEKAGGYYRKQMHAGDFYALVGTVAYEAGLVQRATEIVADVHAAEVSGLGKDPMDVAAEAHYKQYAPKPWEEALEFADALQRRIENIPDKAVGFRESVLRTVRSIAHTIKGMQWVTEKQWKALENIDKGIRKWGV